MLFLINDHCEASRCAEQDDDNRTNHGAEDIDKTETFTRMTLYPKFER
jgi:hypothetical protein